MNVGIDLDGIFIDCPPLIPKKTLEWLYRGPQASKIPHYRFPKTQLEQQVRVLSHYYLFRPRIEKNIQYVQTFKSKKDQLFLVSSRYKFLKKPTEQILKQYHLTKCFKSINLNLDNLQPHLFKEKKVINLKLDIFVDDDLKVLKYLSEKYPRMTLIWYNQNQSRKSMTGIHKINSLQELDKYLK